MSPDRGLLRRSIALPSDHGTWVFLLSPLAIGLAVGGRWTIPATYLVVASICGFLSRQPMTVAVKALAGRRSREDLPAALCWSAIYGVVGGLFVLGLVLRGFGYLLYLAIPGVAVFVWYLWLVARREERRQIGLEILGAAVFALTAPAGLWAGVGEPVPLGWFLWALAWAQSAASIVFVYLRLRQRELTAMPPVEQRLELGLPAVALTSVNLIVVIALGIDEVVSQRLALAYLPQWVEAVRGSWRPALGVRPTAIGLRQLAVSTLYTMLFVWGW